VETVKNFQSFTASGGTSVPDWATKMYYLVVGGGGTNLGGQVVQGDTAVTGSTSLTVTVGGAAANSSLAISGGSTFTATGAGGTGTGADGQGNAGTQPTAPFNVGYFGGGGGTSQGFTLRAAVDFGPPAVTCSLHGNGGFGGGGASSSSGSGDSGTVSRPARNGAPNSGGAGGGIAGGSGIVLLYFS
jgi:hypothetical protein